MEGMQFQNKGIETALKNLPDLNPKTIGEEIVKAVKLHSTGRSAADDITLVCLGRDPS
jgi:serine phosphatase RsbU (regulator of sigma subunit)